MKKFGDIKKLIVVVIAIKVVVVITIAIAHYTIPFCDYCYENNFRVDSTTTLNLASSYQTWDTQYYLYIANNGYAPNHPSNAFYPLFPALIAVSDKIIPGSTIVAAWILSSLVSIIAIVLIFRFVERWKNRAVAWKTIILLLSFPTAFYLHLPYTEGLFLLFVVLLLYGLYFRRNTHTWLASALLPLTRPQGLLMLPVILTHFWQNRMNSKSVVIQFLLAIVATLLGAALYFLIMFISTGNIWAGFEAQTQYLSQNSLTNLLHPIEWLRLNFINVDWTLQNVNNSFINRAFFIAFLAVLILIWRKLDRTLFVFAVMLGLLPALSGHLIAFPRFMVVILPIFLALALTIKRRAVLVTWVLYGICVQLFLLVLHSQNYFVA